MRIRVGACVGCTLVGFWTRAAVEYVCICVSAFVFTTLSTYGIFIFMSSTTSDSVYYIFLSLNCVVVV